MSRIASSYLSTRLSLLASRLIALENWQTIIESELDELQQRFDCCIDDISDSQAVEKKLISLALQDFQVLFRPFYGVEREFLNYTVHWYELTNLKTLIRGKFTGKTDLSIEKELIDLGQFAVLPLKRLLQADDPQEMLRLLEPKPYSSIVRQARSIYEEEGQNLFSLDAAIDRHFFTSLMQRIRFLEANDQKALSDVFGALMDRINLLWLIRYRFSYNLSPAKSFYLLATTGRALHADKLMQLARLDTIDEVIKQLPESINHLLDEATDLTHIENLMEHYTLLAALNGLHKSTSMITRVFSYVLLRESEIHLLQAVITGKSLDFHPDLINRAIRGISSNV